MSIDPNRLFEHVHGHLGWLAAALLAHPAVVLRTKARRAHLAVGLSTALVTAAAGLGAWVYVAYREKLRQDIFLHAPAIGLLFERKEHLAFAAVMLSWTGCAAYFAAWRASGPVRELLRSLARFAFTASALVAIAVALLGTYVSVHRSF